MSEANRIRARLADDARAAIKAGDRDRAQTLRLLLAALDNAQLEVEGGALSEARELEVLSKQVKLRRDAIEQARSVGREDVATRETREIEVIQRYLPRMLSGAELATAVATLAAEIGYRGQRDNGRFMKEWMARFRGRAEGREVQERLAKLAGPPDSEPG